MRRRGRVAASGGTAGLGNGRCARNASKPAEVKKKCVQPALSAMGTTPRPVSGETTAANISAAAKIAVTRGVARELGGGPCLTRGRRTFRERPQALIVDLELERISEPRRIVQARDGGNVDGAHAAPSPTSDFGAGSGAGACPRITLCCCCFSRWRAVSRGRRVQQRRASPPPPRPFPRPPRVCPAALPPPPSSGFLRFPPVSRSRGCPTVPYTCPRVLVSCWAGKPGRVFPVGYRYMYAKGKGKNARRNTSACM